MELVRGAAIVMIALIMTGCGHGDGGSQSAGRGPTTAALAPDTAVATIDRELASAKPPTAGVTLGDGFGDPELVAFQRLGWVHVDRFAPPHMPYHVALTSSGQRVKSEGRWVALPSALGESYRVPYGTFKLERVTGFRQLPDGPNGAKAITAEFDFKLVPSELGRALLANKVRSPGFDAKRAATTMHGRQLFTLGPDGSWAPDGKPELDLSDALPSV